MDRPLVGFFALAYGLAWGIWLLEVGLADAAGLPTAEFVAAIEDGEVELLEGTEIPHWLLYLITRVQDFSFTIAGLIMIVATGGVDGLATLRDRLLKFRIPVGAYLLALAPVALYGVAALIANNGDGGGNLDATTLRTILFSLHAGLLVSLFLRGAMGEEIGLRGFALPHLQRRTTPFRASLLLGIGWAGWHLPALLDGDPVNAVIVVLIIVGLSFVFTWLFNHSGGSLIPPLLFHAFQNWEEAFETLFPSIIGTDWEAIAAVGLLVLSVIAATRVARHHTNQTSN